MASAPKESTIRLMTRLSIEHNAVNLSQGFPNEAPQFEMVWSALSAIVGGTQQGIDRINHLRVDELLHEDETTADLGKLSVKDMFARAASKADMYNQYSIPFGLVELRKAIADYTHTFYGFTPDVDNGITVCLGATEGFATSLRALCSPGDKVAFFQPFHELYTAQVAVFHLEPVFLTLTENSAVGSWDFDRSAVESALRGGGVRALLLNTPHNPTGKVFSLEELTFLCNICKDEGIVVITDEIYEHILYPPHKHICCATLPGMLASTVVIQSISKTASATGWRVGWILSDPAITPKIRAVHDSLVIQAPTPLQKGAERLLKLPETFFREELPATYQKKRDLLCAALTKVGFVVSVPQGAYYIFTKYRGVPALSKLSPMEAAMFLIKTIGVATVPGEGFYGSGDHGQEYVRFTFCRSIETLESAVERLTNLAKYTAEEAVELSSTAQQAKV